MIRGIVEYADKNSVYKNPVIWWSTERHFIACSRNLKIFKYDFFEFKKISEKFD